MLALPLALAIAVSAVQHANAALHPGPLNYLFSTNELHRWHHDSRPGRSYVNYGAVLCVWDWDWVFGTFYLNHAERPARAGLEASSANAADTQSCWAQLVAPFRSVGRYPDPLNKNSNP